MIHSRHAQSERHIVVTIVTSDADARRFFRERLLQHSDKRVSLVNEALGGIRVVRQYSWEEASIALHTHTHSAGWGVCLRPGSTVAAVAHTAL